MDDPIYTTDEGTMTNPWWTGGFDLSDWDSKEDEEAWDG